MVLDEIVDVVQARAATGSSPMLVDALTKGTKGKKGKGEGKDTKSKDDQSKGKGWKSKASKTTVPRARTPTTALRT